MSDSNDESGLGSERNYIEPMTFGEGLQGGRRFPLSKAKNGSTTREFLEHPSPHRGQGAKESNCLSGS